MYSYHRILRLLPCILLFTGIYAYAGDKYPPGMSATPDSLLPVRSGYDKKEEIAADLQDAETDLNATGDGRRGLIRLLKIVKVKRYVPDSKRGYSLFSHLARFSARLKLYPLAMKFYYRAEEYRRTTLSAWYQSPSFTGMVLSSGAGREGEEEEPLLDSAGCEYLMRIDTCAPTAVHPGYVVRSEPVLPADILTTFDDGKAAASYAMIVHVKQPVPGKRKAFTHINNVGHMFITLIKYNTDNSFTARSFGFYPHKKNIFSATPLRVRSAAVFKDDALHDWDESVGKFISPQRFRQMLDLLTRYDGMQYNLNRNNCTDFGLNAAAIGGINISDTHGSWPLGRGNNPANAGQSILEGKFMNTDTCYHSRLFVSKSPCRHKRYGQCIITGRNLFTSNQ
jgi:hypothetical protein